MVVFRILTNVRTVLRALTNDRTVLRALTNEMRVLPVVCTQPPPVQEVRQALGPVPHDDSLPPGQLAEVEHDLGQAADTLLHRHELPVHHVDSVRGGVRHVLLTRQTCINIVPSLCIFVHLIYICS